MSRKKTARFLIASTFGVLGLTACQKDLNEDNGSQINQTTSQFDYSTTQSASLILSAPSYLKNATFEIYTADPEKGGKHLASARFDETAQFKSNYILPTTLKEVFIRSTYIGLPDGIVVQLENGKGFHDYRLREGQSGSRSSSGAYSQTINGVTYHYPGSYSWSGVPNNLTTPDNLDPAFMDDVNASLPERAPVPNYNPHYLADGAPTELKMSASGDVWVTFIHEGAGYKNVLGYYTYTAGNKPAEVKDIKDIHIVFPNFSAYGSGGGLHAGDKVYLGNFPSHTRIGWVIIQNGWRNGQIKTNKRHFFSSVDYNPESTHAKRRHTVQLADDDRGIIVVGLEDLHRDGGSDDDFNDALFYVTVHPASAVDKSGMPKVTGTGKDTDGDGVPDARDKYPTDASKAFNNYTPFKGGFSSIAFEDQWPFEGDYDFNDLVVNGNFNHITNADNQIVEMEYKLKIRHIGALFHNGFGIQWPFSPGRVQSITGHNITDGLVTLSANGTEENQSKAVLIAFDDAHDNPNELLIKVKLTSPYSYSQLASEGLNPFLISNATRGREIHLANHEPTDLVNPGYFGQGQDISNELTNTYYMGGNEQPWGILISSEYAPPVEQVNIRQAYTKFSDWVNAKGKLNADWYENKPGYRVKNKVQ